MAAGRLSKNNLNTLVSWKTVVMPFCDSVWSAESGFDVSSCDFGTASNLSPSLYVVTREGPLYTYSEALVFKQLILNKLALNIFSEQSRYRQTFICQLHSYLLLCMHRRLMQFLLPTGNPRWQHLHVFSFTHPTIILPRTSG